MKITRQIIVFDAADPAAESAFWAGLLGGTVQAEDDWHSVLVNGVGRLGVQLAPNHVPPDWPDGTPEQQIHLDLWVDDLKAAHEEAISLGARLSIERFEGDFAIATDGLHYFARHLAPADSLEADWVAVGERFLEAPYLWGGRTSEGIDCSGLTQAALTAAGIAAPRDSDMMESRLGSPLPHDSDQALRRGDLIFWKGHIGTLRDAATLLHASGWHMKVVNEPLREAMDRIAANGGGPITSIKRI